MKAAVFVHTIRERIFTLDLPIGSRPRKMMFQDNVLKLWIERSVNGIVIPYEFRYFFDGEPFDSTQWTYIDSIVDNEFQGGFSIHLYWRPLEV